MVVGNFDTLGVMVVKVAPMSAATSVTLATIVIATPDPCSMVTDDNPPTAIDTPDIRCHTLTPKDRSEVRPSVLDHRYTLTPKIQVRPDISGDNPVNATFSQPKCQVRPKVCDNPFTATLSFTSAEIL